MDLLGGWAATLRRLGGEADPGGVRPRLGILLLARYAEPHRRYHTLAHLAAVLGTVDALASCAVSPDTVRLAAWYHDAVYDPRRQDNEAASAELARAELGEAGIAPARIDRVITLVLATAGHDPPAHDRDAAVLCDADLAILAGPAAAYDTYAAAVRQEYAHVAERDWLAGRSAVLGRLLALPQLYRTTPARAWEPAARGNLSRELAALGAARERGLWGGAAPLR